ncbi:MAG TPA: metalloregulator ArsR/SmtB family transcription factor [archaeon]|nr:metalloregulator ArsR/SmtB family transcription factor [archaeon]
MNSNLCESFFAVLADRNRLSIINLILEKDLTVGDISGQLNLEQSLVSHHLKTLKDHGFVESKTKGKNRVYSANKDTVRPLMDIMRSHVSNLCGFACQYKIDQWSTMAPLKSIEHETEVVMEKIKVLTKYSEAKINSRKKLKEVSDFFNTTMVTHFKTEEMTLFKKMSGKAEIVDELLDEHKFMREKFLELKEIAESKNVNRQRLKAITESISKIINAHIDKEENVLMPKAKQLLSKKELEEIAHHDELLEVKV